ncbi:FGGY-family carbohydrate kinase [Chamaesiphon polymorphus]|uniref:D-ribulose kinase n=1 Tax=Chamaesiphon polymorphus CCALA 037 TaxID=2107692 RepID=A0A2T1FMZ7_9CYAN|nr:FGGY-family carbohydrate kinase [Chamaesiphon polymorphus]PSB46384.1 carbohydrate kinase [Chamaesiphon polymorphus CCALA 037]
MIVSLGIDFGTSGVRLVAIDTDCNVLWWGTSDLLTQGWRATLFALIQAIPNEIKAGVKRIAIDGTSSTVLLCDREGRSIGAPILYHDRRGAAVLDSVKSIAPAGHSAIGATSSLAKLLWLMGQPEAIEIVPTARDAYFLHQADWLAYHLHGKLGISDYHNALKLGYDVEALCYPDWLERQPYRPLLPQVVPPGTPIGTVLPQVATELGLAADCIVCAGTTDSIAAFIASGVKEPGVAVTSLGSTLVIKLLSQTRVEDVNFGIYSHRLGDLWLVGGASNTGGAVLRHFFSDAELVSLSQEIDPDRPSNLDYYPLLTPGDRFPINDPHLAPRLTPRPERAVDFLHGLLEGIASIEARGYQLLAQLGATPLTAIYTAGGGAQNPVWTKIRQRYLPVPISISPHQEAAYGAALLAQRGTNG